MLNSKLFRLLTLLFFFHASSGWAAITSVGSAGTGTSTSSDASLAFAPTVTLEVGNVVTAAVALDNTATDDGTTSEITSITDTGTNTWTLLGAFRNGQGGAAAGAQIELWFTKITTQLTVASTITVNFANTITSKAASLWEFTVGSGNSLQSAATAQTAAEDADSNPIVLTFSKLTTKEYLFIRGIGMEGRNNTFASPTANYTALTIAEADTGAAGTSMQALGEFRILSADGDKSDPGSVGATGDIASIYMALQEFTPGGAAVCVRGLGTLGVGC